MYAFYRIPSLIHKAHLVALREKKTLLGITSTVSTSKINLLLQQKLTKNQLQDKY